MIKPTGPLIINLDSLILSKNESEILSDQSIGGVILFNHNYSNTSQIKSLIDSIKDIRDNIIIATDHEEEGCRGSKMALPCYHHSMK